MNTIYHNNRKHYTDNSLIEDIHIYKIDWDYDSGHMKLWYTEDDNIWKCHDNFTGNIPLGVVNDNDIFYKVTSISFNNGILVK